MWAWGEKELSTAQSGTGTRALAIRQSKQRRQLGVSLGSSKGFSCKVYLGRKVFQDFFAEDHSGDGQRTRGSREICFKSPAP